MIVKPAPEDSPIPAYELEVVGDFLNVQFEPDVGPDIQDLAGNVLKKMDLPTIVTPPTLEAARTLVKGALYEAVEQKRLRRDAEGWYLDNA